MNKSVFRYAAVNPVNFLEGPQIDPSADVEQLPNDMNLTDFESFITRIGKYPKQVRFSLPYFHCIPIK